MSDELQILYASFPSSPLCCHLIWANKTNMIVIVPLILPFAWICMNLRLAFNHLLASTSAHVLKRHVWTLAWLSG